MRTIHEVIWRARAEFREMPGLRLKAAQVQRLCGIDKTVCRIVLDALVDEQFLYVTADGWYARVTEGRGSLPQSAKADIKPGTP